MSILSIKLTLQQQLYGPHAPTLPCIIDDIYFHGMLLSTIVLRLISQPQVLAQHGHDLYISTPTGGKRHSTLVDLEHFVQKRQWRKGNLAEGVPHTPTSFQIQGTHATSPDIGIGHCDDVA